MPSIHRQYASQASMQQKSQKMLWYLTALVFAMVGSTYAAVPLYRRFCQATGYGGTVQRHEVKLGLYFICFLIFFSAVSLFFFLLLVLLSITNKAFVVFRLLKKRLLGMLKMERLLQGCYFYVLDIETELCLLLTIVVEQFPFH